MFTTRYTWLIIESSPFMVKWVYLFSESGVKVNCLDLVIALGKWGLISTHEEKWGGSWGLGCCCQTDETIISLVRTTQRSEKHKFHRSKWEAKTKQIPNLLKMADLLAPWTVTLGSSVVIGGRGPRAGSGFRCQAQKIWQMFLWSRNLGDLADLV